MKICCNVKENDVRYCQDCLNKAKLETAKKIEQEFLNWIDRLPGNKKKLNAIDFSEFFEIYRRKFL